MIKLFNIRDAYDRIKKYVRKTPLEYSPYYSKIISGKVYLKLENLQLTGSFKIRGALNKMLQLNKKQKKEGIIAVSAGNHAQGVAYGAKMLGVPAIIVVPENTPKTKIDAIMEYGGDQIDLKVKGKIYDDAEIYARQLEKELNRVLISPYNDPDIIAGQGTIGIELFEEIKEYDAIITPLSGGGLLSGIAIVAKVLNLNVKIYGVQSEACPVMVESLKQGKIVDIPMEESIAEGLHGGVEKDSITFEYIQKLMDEVLLVSEEEIKESIVEFLEHHHKLCEGAGAVGLAAIKRYKEKFTGKKIAIIISGANFDLEDLKKILCKN